MAEFRRFRAEHSDLLDERCRHEQALGSKDGSITLTGTCALCLRVTRFTSATIGGSLTDDGRMVANWREQQVGGCRHSLNSRQRALLHLALSRFGASGWVRSAVLGREDRVSQYLKTLMSDICVWPHLAETGHAPAIPAEAASAHLVVSADYLHYAPQLDAALKEVARVLAPGGCFVFTIPFCVDLEVTQTCATQSLIGNEVLTAFPHQPAHNIGWDIIDRLSDAGFIDAAAHCYWSDEFGYLGKFNLVFLVYR